MGEEGDDNDHGCRNVMIPLIRGTEASDGTEAAQKGNDEEGAGGKDAADDKKSVGDNYANKGEAVDDKNDESSNVPIPLIRGTEACDGTEAAQKGNDEEGAGGDDADDEKETGGDDDTNMGEEGNNNDHGCRNVPIPQIRGTEMGMLGNSVSKQEPSNGLGGRVDDDDECAMDIHTELRIEQDIANEQAGHALNEGEEGRTGENEHAMDIDTELRSQKDITTNELSGHADRGEEGGAGGGDAVHSSKKKKKRATDDEQGSIDGSLGPPLKQAKKKQQGHRWDDRDQVHRSPHLFTVPQTHGKHSDKS